MLNKTRVLDRDMWPMALPEVPYGEAPKPGVVPRPLVDRAIVLENGFCVPRASAYDMPPINWVYTPAYEFDIDDLVDPDTPPPSEEPALWERVQRALNREKNLAGLRFFRDCVGGADEGLRVVPVARRDDPMPDQKLLRRALKEAMAELLDVDGSTRLLAIIVRSDIENVIPLDLLGHERFRLLVVPSQYFLDDDVPSDLAMGRGDILLVSSEAGAVVTRTEIQRDVRKTFFASQFAYRQGFGWMRWADTEGKPVDRVRLIRTVA